MPADVGEKNAIGSIGALALALVLALLVAVPAGARTVPVGAGGTVTVGTVECAAAPCALAAPERVQLRIGGERFWAEVLAPKALAARSSAPIRIKLGKGAVTRLSGRAAKVRVRVVLRAAGSKPSVSNGGKTLTYSLMRGTLTADGVNVFAGFYTPPDNDEFGCVSVAFTTP